MIHVCNRSQIEKLFPGEGKAVISISTDNPANLRDGWAAILHLQFDDALSGEGGNLFTREMAGRILDFWDENSHLEIWVHCDAGLSRSVAVGSFLNMISDRPLTIHTPGVRTDQFRNIHVFNLLRREWYSRQE